MSTEREGTEQALEKMLRGWVEENTRTQRLDEISYFCIALSGAVSSTELKRSDRIEDAAVFASRLPMKLVEAILRGDA